MHKGRLEAFSDGVLAIIITIMVLELKAPKGADLRSLYHVGPVLLGYLLSFIFVAIYWNNHHHLLQAAKHVDGRVLWANQHLLFWLSLIPFSTSWMDDEGLRLWPVAIYGLNLLLCGVAYFFLGAALLRVNHHDLTFAKALGNDFKGKVSLAIYTVGIALAFVNPMLSCACYVLVALIWLVPDRRFERVLIDKSP